MRANIRLNDAGVVPESAFSGGAGHLHRAALSLGKSLLGWYHERKGEKPMAILLPMPFLLIRLGLLAA